MVLRVRRTQTWFPTSSSLYSVPSVTVVVCCANSSDAQEERLVRLRGRRLTVQRGAPGLPSSGHHQIV